MIVIFMPCENAHRPWELGVKLIVTIVLSYKYELTIQTLKA